MTADDAICRGKRNFITGEGAEKIRKGHSEKRRAARFLRVTLIIPATSSCRLPTGILRILKSRYELAQCT